ncbi:GDSL esterase/lipase At5g45950-like [Cornus florida]|uniref:GDSL esterase/lipase At5g45950-like n=1 Tax=Cornus florida TaxID=4283 RepID=UPI00289D6141|nr:GDSL esterase/lipase At5g45950-like [Cornus florida]
MRVTFIMVIIILLSMNPLLQVRAAIDIRRVRRFAAKNNVTCVLVFGDSSVDPGNNNHLPLAPKCNFPPYGKDFFNGRATGRFSNGRLATDFIANTLGFKETIPGFLDPNLKKEDLVNGVSFASGGAGYDGYTTNLSNAIPLTKQLEYFKHYKVQLRQVVGEKKAEEITSNALFVLSMGTNDFLKNYYLDSFRSDQFTIEQYQNYLISRMSRAIKGMYRLGVRRLVVVGLPPFGCSPLVKTLKDETICDESYNKVALSFNSKLKAKMAALKNIRNCYIDIYSIIESAIQNPGKYGFSETKKGCCGTGTIEYADSCRGLNTCTDRTKYVFWDAVHLTESIYKIIAEEAIEAVLNTQP